MTIENWFTFFIDTKEKIWEDIINLNDILKIDCNYTMIIMNPKHFSEAKLINSSINLSAIIEF